MNKFSRAKTKTDIRKQLLDNWQYFAKNTWILLIYMIVTTVLSGIGAGLFTIIAILMVPFAFSVIISLRGYFTGTTPTIDDSTIVSNGLLIPQTLWLRLMGLNLMISIFTLLWSLLFIVPGIVKAASYSQAQYIFVDANMNGQDMGIFEAITESRKMMVGHKGEWWLIWLSFLGWTFVGLFVMYAAALILSIIGLQLLGYLVGLVIVWAITVYSRSTQGVYNEYLKNN